MKALIIDTSGNYTTVVFTEHSKLLACSLLRDKPLIHLHDLIEKTVLDIEKIQLVAVVVGPGSWTGLNIGVTAAKTLAQVLQVPLVELSTLDILALSQHWSKGPVCTLLDAKRSNVYCGFYTTDSTGCIQIENKQIQLLSFSEFCKKVINYKESPLIIEYGHVYIDMMKKNLPNDFLTTQDFLSPKGLIRALSAGYNHKLMGNELMELSPNYMQQTSAERNLVD